MYFHREPLNLLVQSIASQNAKAVKTDGYCAMFLLSPPSNSQVKSPRPQEKPVSASLGDIELND